MTYQEALEIITNTVQCNDFTEEKDIALSIVQKALKKQIPKKPIKKDIGKLKIPDTAFCPICDNPVIKDETDN